MEILKSVVREIAIIVLLATFLEMLLPKSNMKRFVQVILGLFILISILTPIANLFTSDDFSFHFEAWQYQPAASSHQLEEILAQGQRLYDKAEKASLREYERKLENQIKALIIMIPEVNHAHVSVKVGTDLRGNYGQIEKVIIRIYDDPETQAEQRNREIQLKEVEDVIIEISQETTITQQEIETPQKKRVLKNTQKDVIFLVSNFYGLPTEKIEVHFEN